MAKPGLDGHDRGAKVVAYGLRDAGFEVVYTGLRQTPEMIVNAAVQEDVDVVGLSILSGAHLSLTQRVLQNLKAKGAGDKMVLVGGIISPADSAKLKEMGVAEVFIPGASIKNIAEFIKDKLAGVTREAPIASTKFQHQIPNKLQLRNCKHPFKIVLLRVWIFGFWNLFWDLVLGIWNFFLFEGGSYEGYRNAGPL